jgi:uncharacterized membrane protein YGL010W
MKSIDQLFTEYAKSHTHETNKRIHYLCVPLILYSILALLDLVHIYKGLSLAWVLVIAVTPYYLALSLKFGLPVIIFSALICLSFSLYPSVQIQLYTASFIFIFSWALQFIGHKIEGKKPSFFEDLQFLLIGPLWVTKVLIS